MERKDFRNSSSKERIIDALNNIQPDRVPVLETDIAPINVFRLASLLSKKSIEIPDNLERIEGSDKFSDLYCYIVEKLGLDATCVNISRGFTDISNNVIQDKFGSVYNRSLNGIPCVVEGPIKNLHDLKGFDMASKLKDEDFYRVKYTIEKVGNSKFHFMFISDPFKLSWQLRGGMQNFLMDLIIDPELVKELSRITTDYVLKAIDIASDIGIDGIFFPGDLAGETNTIMSPDHYREFLKPSHVEIVKYVHNKGLKIVKHSDGNIWPILDDFLEIGFDGIHPIQPQCMDISEVKKHLAGKACIVGNIDCRNLLPYGSKEEVEQSVKETIRKIAPGGGYIVSSSNSIHPDVNPENYITMIEAVHKYGKGV